MMTDLEFGRIKKNSLINENLGSSEDEEDD